MKKERLHKQEFELNIWATDFRVIISDRMIKKIKEKIKDFRGPYLLYKSTHITPTIYYRLLKGKGSHVKNYYTIITFLNLDLKEAEKEIIGLTYNGSKKVYPFIKHFSPLLFRIVCHVIGDGTIASKNTCRWIQHETNSFWLVELMKQQLNITPSKTKSTIGKCDVITIPSYFSMLLENVLGLKVKSLKSPETIENFINYPKEYRLQFLAAFIVDEGNIRYKRVRALIISQIDKSMLDAVSRLLDSLGYIHSEICQEIFKTSIGGRSYKRTIYRMNIYSPGVNTFYKDIKFMIEKYGPYAGLWHKQKCLENYIFSLKKDPERLSKIIKVNKMINFILGIKDYVSYEELRKNLAIKNELKKLGIRFLISKFYELAKQGKVKRLSKGYYRIQKF